MIPSRTSHSARRSGEENSLLLRDVEARARGQVRPDLPDRGVERGTGEAGGPGGRRDPIRSPVPGGEVREAAVLDLHPLGPPRGARGVDDVGQVVQAHAGELRRAFRLGHVLIQADDLNGIRGRRGPLGEEQGGSGVREDKGEPLLRVGGIERQKAPPRLEHGEDRHQRLGRPVGQHGDRNLGPHPERGEVARQPARPQVELAIGQAEARAGDRQGVRRFGGLEREDLVNRKAGELRDRFPLAHRVTS